jgi:hypothetical protein
MGVPAEAVYRRMEADGAAEGDVAALQAAVRAHLAGGGAMARFMKQETAAEEAAGAPAPAAAAGAGAAAQPAEPSAAPPTEARKAAQEAGAGDPRFAKYSAMKRCGVPLGAIKGQMGADGLGREQVLTFLRAHATQAALESMQLLSPPGKGAGGGGRGAGGGGGGGEAAAAGAAAGSATGVPADATGDGDAAASGPVTLKLHWDPLHLDDDRLQASVWGRLRSKQAAAATSTSSAGDAFALDSSSSSSARGLESGAGGGADDAIARRPASPLSRDAAGGSERGVAPSAPSLHQEDVSFITTLFAAKQAAKPPAPPAGGGGPGAGSSGGGAAGSAAAGEAGPALQTTLDARRASNLNILLAQFRRFPSHAAIAAAVHRPGDGPLTRDALDKLSQLIPKPDELRAVKGFKGDPAALMECDRFFLAIARVPRFPAKVAACITLLSFPDIAADVTQRAGVVRGACAQVLASEGLQVVLGQALALGNLLNKGHSRLTAQAITLESLLKLASTKAADKKTSLMDALAVTLTSKHAASAPAGAGAGTGAAAARAASFDLAADLPLLAAARRIEVGEVASDLKQLQAAVLAACREAEAEAADLEREANAAARAAAGPVAAVSAVTATGGGNLSALAEMMARRLATAGGTAPAAPPLPPASTSAAAAPASTAAPRAPLSAAGGGNPCFRPDRQHFVDSLRAFGLAKQPALAEVQAAVAAADARLREVAAYFGEEPASATCASLLGPLLQFVGDFGASRKRAAAQQAAAKGGKA